MQYLLNEAEFAEFERLKKLEPIAKVWADKATYLDLLWETIDDATSPVTKAEITHGYKIRLELLKKGNAQ